MDDISTIAAMVYAARLARVNGELHTDPVIMTDEARHAIDAAYILRDELDDARSAVEAEMKHVRITQ